MDLLDAIRTHCLQKEGVTEELPFGPETLVFKVHGKMFALVPLDRDQLSLTLKNRPEKNEELRATYDQIVPGYHTNKKHWNTVLLDARLTSKEWMEWIDESYQLVLSPPKRNKIQDI